MDQSHELVFNWGQFDLTDADTEGHFLALGTTGSGKTIILRLLMQDSLCHVGKGFGYRGLVYDAKQDVLPILARYCTGPILTLNPFDARSYSWWISKDVQESAVAMEIAFTLIGEVTDNSAFFRNAARHITWGLMCSFMLSGLDWTLGDLLRGVRDPVLCERILLRHPETSHVAKMYFRDEKLKNDILATVSVTLMLLEPIAACWDVAHAEGKKLSLRECMHSEQVIILGNTEVARVPIDNINRCIFKRWTDLILSQPDGTSDRFWTFIDELSEAGPLPSIVSLLKKSRSKGGRVCIACQSIAGLQDSKMYGEYVSKDMLAVLSNRFVGRLECPITSEYLSQWIGEHEKQQISISNTFHPMQPNSKTTNQSRVTERVVLPSEFMGLPACGAEEGLSGLFKMRSTNACWDTIPPDVLFQELLLPKAENVVDFVPRDPSCQLLRPWTPEEEELFAPEVEESVFKVRPVPAKAKKAKPEIDDFKP